jgi:hypothetical protein
MYANLLSIRTFGDALKSNMSQTAKINDYDTARNAFVNRTNTTESDATTQEVLYFLLFEALIYTLREDTGYKFPDISKVWISRTINGKDPLNANIKKAAGRKEATHEVAEYFRANLIPNITDKLIDVVMNNVFTIVEGDETLGDKKKKSLKRIEIKKEYCDYLAEVWVLAVLRGNGHIKTSKQTEKETVAGILESTCREIKKESIIGFIKENQRRSVRNFKRNRC